MIILLVEMGMCYNTGITPMKERDILTLKTLKKDVMEKYPDGGPGAYDALTAGLKHCRYDALTMYDLLFVVPLYG